MKNLNCWAITPTFGNWDVLAASGYVSSISDAIWTMETTSMYLPHKSNTCPSDSYTSAIQGSPIQTLLLVYSFSEKYCPVLLTEQTHAPLAVAVQRPATL